MGVVEFNDFMRAAKDRDEAFFDLANAAAVRYTVNQDVQLELKQNTELHDCCGGIIWETSFALSAFLQRTLRSRLDRSLKKVRVVELGAGLSLAGLGCSVVLTDVSTVLPLLHHNIKRNEAVLRKCKSVTAMPLDWESEAELQAVKEQGPYDVLVATDVVFAERLVQPLLDAVAALAGPSTCIWFCLQERSPEAFKLFMTKLDATYQVNRIPTGDIEFTDEECVLVELLPKGSPTTATTPAGEKKKAKRKKHDQAAGTSGCSDQLVKVGKKKKKRKEDPD